jgi:hypothetical protein
VTLLRVYGLTHLEEWKWDVWEAESRARRDGTGIEDSAATMSGESSIPRRSLSTVEDTLRNEGISHNATVTIASQEPTLDMSSIESLADTTSLSTTSSLENLLNANVTSSGNKLPATTDVESSLHTDLPYHSGDINHDNNDNASVLAAESISQPQTSATQSNIAFTSLSSSASVSAEPSNRTDTLETPEFHNVSSSLRPSSSSSASSPLLSIPIPSPTGGESIYRTIMNRLTALEANQTLYSRYVEEQSARTHVVLRRLSEDIGRLDGIVRFLFLSRLLEVYTNAGERTGQGAGAGIPADNTGIGKSAEEA